jgi:hypothetical protein
MTGIGVGPNTPGVPAIVGAVGTDAGPLPHPAASSAKEAPTASRVMTFLVIEDMWPSLLERLGFAHDHGNTNNLEALVRPVADVVEKILHAVRILTAGSLARRARGETVYGAFQDEVVLIPAR